MHRLALALPLVIAGCGLGRLVHPNEPLQLTGDETLLALEVHTNEYATLTFCRDADYGSCLTTGQISRNQHVQIFVVPEGRYCLLEILVEPDTGGSGSIDVNILPEQSLCFTTSADAITYPGDLEIDVQAREGIWYGVRPRWHPQTDFDARLYAEYPGLNGREIRDSRPVPYR